MTASPPLDDDLRRFVLTSIPSVPYLEAVLLLRADRACERSPAELARALYISEKAAAELLQAMSEAGIVQLDGSGRYRWEPADPGLAAMIDRLAQAYARNLIAVTNLIHDRVQKNAQRFADAFRLKDR